MFDFDPACVIDSYAFYMTCGACPEQYDVLYNGKQVAYIRLRWGHLRVETPDCGGETVYEATFNDGFQGCFESDEERIYHLEQIAKILNKKRCAEAQGGH